MIAEACRRNPRSIVRLLNRVMVISRISKLDGKDFDPLALLLHTAIDEDHCLSFLQALGRYIILENKDKPTIGEFLADQLKESVASHTEWIEALRNTTAKITGLQKAIEILEKNEHLYNLLRLDVGRKWLSDEKFCTTLRETSETTAIDQDPSTTQNIDFPVPPDNRIPYISRGNCKSP